MTCERMKENEQHLARQVAEMLKRAEEVDEEEDRLYGPDRSGYELPAEFADRAYRLRKIREAKAALEAKAKKRKAEP